jgi:hypothetical protein
MVAAICVLFYAISEWNLPSAPDLKAGHIFKILFLGRTYGQGPLFVYGNRYQQILCIILAVVGIASAVAGGVVYYVYNPSAFYRGARGQMRQDD